MSTDAVGAHTKRFRELVVDGADLAAATDCVRVRSCGIVGRLGRVVQGVKRLLSVSCRTTVILNELLKATKRPARAVSLLCDMLQLALREPSRVTLELKAGSSASKLARVAAKCDNTSIRLRLVCSKREAVSAVLALSRHCGSGAVIEFCGHGSSPCAVQTVPFSLPYIELAGENGRRELFEETVQKLAHSCDEFQRVPPQAETESEMWIMERVQKTKVVAVEAVGLNEAALFACAGHEPGTQAHLSEGARIWKTYSEELSKSGMRMVCGGTGRAHRELWKLDTDRRPQLAVVAPSCYSEGFPVSPDEPLEVADALCTPGLALEVRLRDVSDCQKSAAAVTGLIEQGASVVHVCV